RRPHDDPAGAEMAGDIVVQGPALAQRHPDHAALGLLGGLAERLGHLARLAGAVADAAAAVAGDDDRGEAEAPAALDHLGDAVDADQLLDQLAVFTAAIAWAAIVARSPSGSACHALGPS